VDRSQYTYSSLDELRQIQYDARQSHSIDDLRQFYERVQVLRRTLADDFDMQLFIAEVQEEIIEHARRLREEDREPRTAPKAQPNRAEQSPAAPATDSSASPDLPELDTKTWQRATYLALFFTLIICAAFFYLIQTARKINLAAENVGKSAASETKPAETAAGQNVPAPASPNASTNPTLRLYTDLVPATVTLDDAPPQDLKDGEMTLDNLQPGQHSIKITGRNGSAAFSFDVSQKAPPRVVGLPTTSNAMAVLVSSQDGQGKLVTNADNAAVAVDGKPAGNVGPDGLKLTDLGTADHDLQVSREKDRQRFVLTYTPAPALTAYVKSDPNAGTVVVMTGQDNVDVYVNGSLWRRKTDRGQLRLPLKVGEYTIRVHKDRFIDPPPEKVQVKKAEESAISFRLQPVPEIATLDIKGALPGTMVYLDKEFAAAVGPEGNATLSNVKPGQHIIELRRDQAMPKRFERAFKTGEVVVLSGPDVTLEKVVTESNKPASPPPDTPSPEPPKETAGHGMELEAQQVRKGGGFVSYHIPKSSGRYSFQAQVRKSGGLFKKGKLQWYAGYQDFDNYVMFSLDGKRASMREVRDGKGADIDRVPFNLDTNEWVQVDLVVKADSITARVKTPDTPWTEIGTVTDQRRDLTQGKVGFYIPGSDEVAISGFKFTNR
jgi:hypothetical protein